MPNNNIPSPQDLLGTTKSNIPSPQDLLGGSPIIKEAQQVETTPIVEKGTPSYKQDFNPVKQAQYIDNGVWDAGDENMSMSRMYNQQKADETVKNLPKMSMPERNSVLNNAKNTLSNYYDTKINIEKQKFSEDFRNDYLENKPIPVDIYAGSDVSKRVDDNITAYQTQLNNQLTKIDVEAYQLNLKDVAVDLSKDFDPSTQDIKTIEQNAFKIGALQQYPTHENLQEDQQLRADLKNNKVDAYLKQQEQSNNPDAVAMDNDEYSKLVNNGVEAKLDIAKQTQNGYDSRIKLLENVDIVTKNIEKAQQAKEKAEQLFALNPLNKTPQNLEIYNKSVKYLEDATKDLEQLNQYASQEEKTLPQLKEEKKKWLDYEVNLQRVKQSVGKEYTDWKKISDKKTVEFNTQFDEANKKLIGMGRSEDDLTQVTGKAILDWATGTIAKGLNIAGDFIEPTTESQKDLYALKDLGNEELRKKYFGIPEAGYVSKQVLEQTPILDENGNIKDYKFNFNIAALPFQTIKVYAESKVLGYGGFLAGEAVEGSLQGLKFAESYLGRSAYSALKGSAQFVGMYPATYVLYGQDMFDQEFQKTGNAELSGKIMSVRIAFETVSELLHPWEINQFKGADKIAKDMSEKEAYNISMREFGTSKWDKALLYLYGGKEFAKTWAFNGKEEYLEEFASNVSNWLADKVIKNNIDPTYRQDNEMSIANEYLTAVNTIASMGLMSGQSAIREHETAINTAQYIVGQNPQAFLDKNKELFDKGKISQEVLDKRNADVNKIKDVYGFASKDINKITQSLKEAKDKLSLLQPTKFEKFFGITNTQKKVIEDELQTHADNQSFLLFINNKQILENSAKIPELLKKINLLGDEKSKPQQEELDRLRDEMLNLELQNEQIADNASQYIDKFADLYGSTVAKANVITEENPEIPKLEDAIVPKYKDGIVKIPTNKGEKEFKVGEKYIVGRQLLFDSQDPIRFPEITFLGYDLDENGKPKVDDRGVPVVKIRTKNLKGQTIDTTKPVDSFKNYTLGSEKALNATDAGRFYNKFKNKKFTLSLTQTKKNKEGNNYEIVNYIGKKLGIKAKDVKQLEGVLSAETNAKGQIETYFNYKNPDTGKPEQILLTDYLIKGNGDNSFLKPKEIRSGSIIKKGQFESTTAEDLADLELFSPTELADYNKHVEDEQFAELKLARDSQNKRRKEYINGYIDKISRLLKITESKIDKVSAKIEKLREASKLLNEAVTKENPNVKSLLSVKEKEEYNSLNLKELKITYLLNKAKSIEEGSYPQLQDLQDNLKALELERDEKQADIQEELDFANDLLEQEFPSDLGFTDYLKKEKKLLLDAVNQNNKIIEVLKEQIDSFKDLLSNLKDTINSVFSYNSLTNEIERSSTKPELESKIKANERFIDALENKTEEAKKEIAQYTKLINFLKPFEAARKEKEKLRKKKELLDLLKKQSDDISSKDKQTSSNRRDKTKNAKEDGSWESNKKSLQVLTSSTTSGGYNYQEFLDNPDNNYANRRFVYFTNSNSNFDGYYLLPITSKSAKTDKYDLSKILYEKELSTDIKMVVVKKTKDGYAFLDMEGNIIDNPTADNVVYTALPSDKLTDSKGLLRFNKKDGVTEEEIKAAQQEFIKFRESIFNATTPTYFPVTGVSKGIPIYDNTEEEILFTDVDSKFDEVVNRKPVIPTLLEGIKEVKTLINIATVESKDGLGEINDPNNNPVNVPLGRPVLVDKKSKKMQFLDNHYLSKSKQETIVKLIVLLARKIEKNIESNNDKIIDTNITGYLGSILYWRNPEKEVDGKKQDPTTISSNQVWISFDIDGAYLNIGTSTKISLFDVENDIISLQIAVSLMWHNVNKEALSKSIDSKKGYTEISDVDLSKNTYTTTDWDSYEEYLLSESNPNDGSPRPIQDIPLTTNVITNVKPFDEKGNPVPNYKTQYESKYFTFQRPYFTAKKQVVVNTNNDTKPNVVSTKLAQKATDIANKQTVKPTEQGLTNIIKAANFIENLEVGKEYEISSTKTGISIIKFKVNSIENSVITTSDVVENKQNQTTNTFIEIMTSSVEDVNELPKIAIENYLNAIQSEKNLQEALRILPSNFTYSEIGKEEGKEEGELENLGESLGWTTNEEDKAKAEKEKTESTPTPTVSLKDRIKNAKNNNGTNNTNYRLAHTKQYVKEDLDLARSWFKTRFPNLEFNDVKGLIDGVAFGQFTKNGIILSDAAEIGTVYHEAFEAVAGLLLTKRQWNALQSEFKRRQGSFIEYTTGKKIEYSKATSEQVKEQLAEEYREYELSGGKSIFEGEFKRNSLFRRIYNLIKSLIFGNQDNIKEVFSKISKGEYGQAQPSKWERPWNINKAYRIGNIENGIFAYQVNKSLTSMMLLNLFDNPNVDIYSLFTDGNVDPKQLYSTIKEQLNTQYNGIVTDSGEEQMLSLDEIRASLDDFDNFFKQVIESDFSTLPEVYQNILNKAIDLHENDVDIANYTKAKLKDALTAYVYMSDNWGQTVEDNIQYLKRYKIEIDSLLETEQGNVTTVEELKTPTEYTKDPFSIDLKDNTNSKVKLLLATLRKRNIVEENGQPIITENDFPLTKLEINDIGLPETADFSTTFRTVINTILPATNIEEQLELIKEASIQNPELISLWYRLKGDKTYDQLTEGDLKLRVAFSNSLNKYKADFVRQLTEVVSTDMGEQNDNVRISSTIIHSLQDATVRTIKERWLNSIKELYKENSPYFYEEKNVIKIKTSHPDIAKFANKKDFESNLELLSLLGFDFDFNISSLSKEQLSELQGRVADLRGVLLSSKDYAKILNGDSFDFNNSLNSLANFEYSVNKRSKEVNHYNVEGEKQFDVIGLSFFTIITKDINISKTLQHLLKLNPHLKDLYHTNSILYSWLFRESGERSNIELKIEPIEGSVSKEAQEGTHTSNLSYADRLLLEFNSNLKGKFFIFTPADIKTENAMTLFNKQSKESEMFVTQAKANNFNFIFDKYLKGYLENELLLAKDIKENPKKRRLKEYNQKLNTKYSGERTKGNSLRFFENILSFDYSQAIDTDVAIDKWIEDNREQIVKDIENYINSVTDDTIESFEKEGILSKFNDQYEFKGLEIDTEKPYLQDGLVKMDEEQLRNLLNFRSANYVISIFEQFTMFLGDPAQFAAPTKRVKSFVSSRESNTYDTNVTDGSIFDRNASKFYNSATLIDDINTEQVELPSDAPGFQNFNSQFTGTTFEDVKIVESSIEEIKDEHRNRESKELFFTDYENLTDFLKNKLNEKLSPLNDFEKTNEADAQAYMTLPLFRQFLIRSDMWNDDLEKMYQYDLAYERSKVYIYPDTEQGNKLKDLDQKILNAGNPNTLRNEQGLEPTIYPVIKPIGAGVRAGDLSITTLDKNSVLALSYRLLEERQGLNIYNEMIKTNTHYGRFKSSHKVGEPSILTNLYDKEGNNTPNILSTDQLLFKHFAIQVETRGVKDKAPRGSQLTKLATINLMSVSVPIDFINERIENRTDKPDSSEITNEKAYDKYLKEFSKFTKTALREINDEWNTYSEEEKQSISPAYKLVQQHTEVLKNLTEVYTKELFDRVGITETSTGFEISNYTELEKIIKEELKDRNATKDLQNAVKLKDGKFELPFDLLPNGFKIQPLLLSLVDKMVAKPKLFGKSLPQVASTLFEKEKRNLVYKKDGRWTKVEDINSLSTEERDSVKITSNELSFYKKGNKQYIEVLLPAVFKDKLGRLVTDLSQVTPEMLKAIGFRIPTQELSSVENIVIKGFLPLEYGNMIVVPSSITTKAGSDFDIDKLNLYLFNYFYKDGLVQKIQYLTTDNSTEEERYKEFIKNKIWDIFDDIKEEDEYKASAKEKLQPIFDKLSEIVDKELKNTEESEQASQAFQEFKSVVNELNNERLSYGITQIIKKSKTVSIYQRQENLENYIKSQTDISNPEDVKKLNQILLAYDYYISLMNEVGKARHLLQFAMRRSVGYNDFKKQIKDVIEDVFSDYVISEDLTIPGTLSFDKFKELPIYQQNSRKALENRYIETLISLLELPENYTRLTTPNSAKALEDMSFKIEELENKAKLRKQGVSKEDVDNTPIGTEQQSKDYLNPIQNAFIRYSFQVGKGGVGIGAVGITNHAINQLVNSVATNINTLSILFPSSGIKVEDAFGNISYVNNLSFQRDAEGNWVSNNLSGFINGFVDVANNPFIIKINGNLSTAGAYILSNKLGIGIEQTILMFNQPIVKEFERITALNEGILSLDNLNAKDRATEVFGLRPGISYSRGFFDNKELEDMIVEQHNLSEKQKMDQFMILQAYIELKDLSNSLIEAVNTYNWDTDGLATYPSVFSKIFENKEYAENYDQDAPRVTLNADDLFFKNVKDAYSNFSQATKDLFVSLQNEPFNKATRPLIEPYFKQNMSKKEKEKAVNAIQREVVNYLLLTTPVTIDGKEITIGNLVKALLVNYEKSPAKTLKEIQNKIKKGKLDSNFAVNELFSLFSVSSGRKTNNIRILNKQKDIEYNDLIIESLKEMLNSSNQELASFAKNLFLLALVQSGVNQSRISISQYIPAEFYNNITSQILAKVNTSQIDYSSFKHLFYANKFNDSTFTKTLTKRDKKNSFGITKGLTGNTVELSKRYITKGIVKTSKKWDNVFQVKFYQVDTNPKTNLPYSEDEIKEFISRNDYSFLKTRVFQRIEDPQGIPIVFQKNPENKNILKYIYREVGLKGDGQFALEYTDKAALHPEIPYTNDATLVENLGKAGIFSYSIDLEQENFENDKNTINITPTENQEVTKKQEVIEQPIQNDENLKDISFEHLDSNKTEDNYDIFYKKVKIGILTVNNLGYIDNIEIDKEYRNKGLGKSIHRKVNSDLLNGKLKSDSQGRNSADEIRVWESLVKSGEAEKTKNGWKFVEQPINKEIKPNNIKVISEPYGVVTTETSPSESKTQEFVNVIQPQIQKQAYKENNATTANDMFMYGLRWTRKGKAKAPINNRSYANGGKETTNALSKDGYVYDTLDQNGKPLAPLSELQPIISEIEKSLGIDMSDYDAVIGNIYLPGQNIATHRDTTESLSARNYPVIVYTIGNDSGISVYENEKNPGSASFASNKKITIPTKNGSIYTFGMDGKGRFEVAHDTPKNIKRDVKFPPITMPNGKVITNYTITLTFRRAADLDINTPVTPKKLTSQPTEIKPKIDISNSTKKSPYFEKDKRKFASANKLIARGSANSSSEAYRIAVGNKANTGVYDINDIVAISVEGNRAGRIKPDYKELEKAVEANVTFITDNTLDRNRDYNIGEREIGEYLESKGYSENGDGIWTKPKIDSSKKIEEEIQDLIGNDNIKELYNNEFNNFSVVSVEYEKGEPKTTVTYFGEYKKDFNSDIPYNAEEFLKNPEKYDLYYKGNKEITKEEYDKALYNNPYILVKIRFGETNSTFRVNNKGDIIEGKRVVKNAVDFNELEKLTQEQPIVEETKEGEMTLKDGKNYNRSEIGTKMLEEMGYSPMEIGKLLKEICG